MSSVSLRKLRITPLQLGRCSRAVVLPAWWNRSNHEPLDSELEVSLNTIGVRPVDREIESKRKPEIKDTLKNGVEKRCPR